MSDLPMYKQDADTPVAKRISTGGMNLPSWPALTDEQVDEVCAAIKEFMARRA
jgi:dTDP-4-amino-4,6-dideoxygalactose transaminase